MAVPIAGGVGNVLPCRQVDPELFFAEVPADVEEAKALCRDCPIRGPAWRVHSSGVSRGASGVASCSWAGLWWPASDRGRPRKYPLADPYDPATGGREAAA